MRLVLCDDSSHFKFAPITLTRPLGDLRMGIFTAAERWKFLSQEVLSYRTENPYIKSFYDNEIEGDFLFLNARVIPSAELAASIMSLKIGEELIFKDTWIAKRGFIQRQIESPIQPVAILKNRWDLYLKNDVVLESDFAIITKNRVSQPISTTNTVIGDPNRIFLEEGAVVEACILNVNTGPIYIGKNAEIMEGSVIRGSFSLGEGAGVKMGAKIYGATSIGPYCKVGGEISNSIFLAYSNKGHDGFVGNAYIGAWCNLGADTNCSNLKNNYGHVKTYCFETQKMVQTDVTFMGVFMGDHSKCSINTMFNTATVVGVSANIFSSGFPPKYVTSFAWGEKEKFDFEKALEVAEAMMKRRGLKLSEPEKEILRKIYAN